MERKLFKIEIDGILEDKYINVKVSDNLYERRETEMDFVFY